MLIINPGSTIGEADEQSTWTNTYEGARAEAQRWLANMRGDGITHVELLDRPDDHIQDNGRWTFGFRHTITGVVVELSTHGISDLDAYRKEHVFTPKVYWNGSSCSTPEVENWAAEGFEAMKTFRQKEADCG